MKDVVITLERTQCFGSCPVYKLTVYGDGRVVYEGGGFVKIKGEKKKRDIDEIKYVSEGRIRELKQDRPIKKSN